MVTYRFTSHMLAEAGAIAGQTVRLVLLSGTTVTRETTLMATIIASEIASTPGYTSRPSATIPGPAVWDATQKRIRLEVPSTSLTISTAAGVPTISFTRWAFILGGSATIGDTTGVPWLIEVPPGPQEIYASTQRLFPLFYDILDTDDTIGV